MIFMVSWRNHDDKRTAVPEAGSSLTPEQRVDVGEGVRLRLADLTS